MIGWFGIPGSKRASDSTVVHAVMSTSDTRPLCGARIREGMEFQRVAFGYNEGLIECENCLRSRALLAMRSPAPLPEKG